MVCASLGLDEEDAGMSVRSQRDTRLAEALFMARHLSETRMT
jgi:hypothetical protein